jgi:hypothetical protein
VVLPFSNMIGNPEEERRPRRCIGFLQAGHVRLAFLKPGQDSVEQLLDRIDVPGCYSHCTLPAGSSRYPCHDIARLRNEDEPGSPNAAPRP